MQDNNIIQEPWAKEITKDDLPNQDLKIIADIISLEVAIIMMCEFEGVSISVPQKATQSAKIKYILKHYDGSKDSRYRLSRICKVSEGFIYKVVREHLKNKKRDR